eukprot:TRINITY_DN22968_c0_g1_i1.p1 TRINITY_DN22968_c0_g1~~TRINITY_DN22968_c0_g1_i1.p1  ORF type:complete len:100 (-),score=23.75 TRINITY_DN22968_c0_g1_i1:55-315(-)
MLERWQGLDVDDKAPLGEAASASSSPALVMTRNREPQANAEVRLATLEEPVSETMALLKTPAQKQAERDSRIKEIERRMADIFCAS